METTVHAVRWSGNNSIARNQCFTDEERAKNYAEFLNSRLTWFNKLSIHRWSVLPLVLTKGKAGEEA